MKKIILLVTILAFTIFVSGCNKNSQSSVISNIARKINNASGYKLEGVLQITNNDELYTYNVVVGYKKDNYYRVSLTNKSNSHTQVILKNADGVYV